MKPQHSFITALLPTTTIISQGDKNHQQIQITTRTRRASILEF